MRWLKKESWSPYFGGAVIGVLSWIAFLAIAPLGSSTSYVRTSGMIEQIFSPDYVKNLPYYLKEKPVIDWQWMFVAGVLIGAFISVRMSGASFKALVPGMWKERFGESRFKRWAAAFLGGAVLMFGARMADG